MHRQDDVELVPDEPGDQVSAQLAGHVERDIGVGLREAAEEPRQKREREIARDSDTDRPGQNAAVQAADALVVQGHHLLGIFEDDLALRREPE